MAEASPGGLPRANHPPTHSAETHNRFSVMHFTLTARAAE